MTTLTSLARAQAVAARRRPAGRHRAARAPQRPARWSSSRWRWPGEANAPLAAMVGDDPDSRSLLVVYQPRNRDQRFAFAAELAEIVLGYLDGYLRPRSETVPAPVRREPRTSASPTRRSSWCRTRLASGSSACSAGPPGSGGPTASTRSTRPCPCSAAG